MLPANQARADLQNTRGAVGGYKPVQPPANRPGVPIVPRPPITSPPGQHPGVPLAHGPGPHGAPGGLTPVGAPAMTPPPPAPLASQAPAPAPATTVPGASVTNFGPGNDLLSSQIAPGASAVNRTQLAQNTLKDWDAQNAPALAAGFRNVGQQAAKFGRIGAGMTTNDLTGLQATYDRNRMEKSNELASGLASDTINDERSNRNELRGERGYQTDRSDKAEEDAIRQQVLQDQLLNSRFGRAQGLLGAGYSDDPSGALGAASSNAGSQASGALAGGVDLLKSRQPQQTGPDYTQLLEQLIKQQRGG